MMDDSARDYEAEKGPTETMLTEPLKNSVLHRQQTGSASDRESLLLLIFPSCKCF
jgi:hypothetical protein